MTALVVNQVGKQFGRTWAVRDVSFSLERGRVAALVGQNGAGKTTLMNVVAGLKQPTEGFVAAGSVRFLAQTKPLYGCFTATDMLEFGRRMNPRWDQAAASQWLETFDVPCKRRCDKLSGGQRTQVAMALALGARPDVLLLDEPLADLDPVVRTRVLGRLLEAVAAGDTAVVLSTHVVTDLHGVVDSLLVLVSGNLTLSGDVDDLLAAHVYLDGPLSDAPPGLGDVVRSVHDGRRSHFLLRTKGLEQLHPSWTSRRPSLEELILDHLQADTLLEAAR